MIRLEIEIRDDDQGATTFKLKGSASSEGASPGEVSMCDDAVRALNAMLVVKAEKGGFEPPELRIFHKTKE